MKWILVPDKHDGDFVHVYTEAKTGMLYFDGSFHIDLVDSSIVHAMRDNKTVTVEVTMEIK